MSSKMTAIIVAGGRGERLRPITNTIPKPMVPVNGRPILIHTIDVLKTAGITDFIVALCYLPHVVTEYLGDGKKFGITVKYTFENPEYPLGTAGAIKKAENDIRGTCVVTYADIIRELDVQKMIEFHKQNNAFATINVYKRIGANPKSMVLFDSQNKITAFVERPSSFDLKGDFVWANGSFYIFEPEIFRYIPKDPDIDFGKDVFPKISSERNVFAYPTEGLFIDIGTKEKLETAEKILQEKSSKPASLSC